MDCTTLIKKHFTLWYQRVLIIQRELAKAEEAHVEYVFVADKAQVQVGFDKLQPLVRGDVARLQVIACGSTACSQTQESFGSR